MLVNISERFYYKRLNVVFSRKSQGFQDGDILFGNDGFSLVIETAVLFGELRGKKRFARRQAGPDLGADGGAIPSR